MLLHICVWNSNNRGMPANINSWRQKSSSVDYSGLKCRCFLILAQYLYFKYSLYYINERFTTINKSRPSNVLIPDPEKTEILVFIPESFAKEICHYIGPLTNIKIIC